MQTLACVVTIAFVSAVVTILNLRRQLQTKDIALEDMRRLFRENSERLKLALDGAEEALWDWDITKNSTYYSERWSQMLGYSPEEIGDSVEIWERLVNPDDLAATADALKAHMEGRSESYRADFRMRAKDGGWRWIQARGKVVARSADGRPTRVSGTHLDITTAKQADEARSRAQRELAEAQQNLVRLSRLSGMAEIATSVLHNVGNVLNSLNVATTVVCDKVRGLPVDNLVALGAMLQEREGDIGDFLARDPKGSRVLPYLIKLGKRFRAERQAMMSELEQLRTHVEHIKLIVSTQQEYAKVSGRVEQVSMEELVDDACRILQAGFERHKIGLERDFEKVPPLATEKHIVMQILLNLIRNAKDAVTHAENGQRSICIRIYRRGEAFVRVEVIDSGVGIAQQNLTRIFEHGFTTKPQGHGFGLHSSALDAQKMGGSLAAASDGPGTGARFTLELPFSKG